MPDKEKTYVAAHFRPKAIVHVIDWRVVSAQRERYATTPPFAGRSSEAGFAMFAHGEKRASAKNTGGRATMATKPSHWRFFG